MPGLRGHEPIVIEEFNGLWKRGDGDACPLDHFVDCNNIAFIESGFQTRPGIDTFLPAQSKVLRMYNYKTQEKEGLLILDDAGNIYHSLLDGSDTTYGPILTIADMTDFGFQSYNGRAYISPFKTFTDGLGVEYQKGISGEFVYVYKGDGTNARKAAGFPPSGSGLGATEHLRAFESAYSGVVSKGLHLITVIDDGGNSLVPQYPVVHSSGANEIELANIPLGGGGVASRKVLMTKAIDPKDYDPDQTTYTYYEALAIPDNTTTSARISVADSGLTAATAAGVAPAATTLVAENTVTSGFADIGFHIIAVVYETDTGYLTALGPEKFAEINIVDYQKGIKVTNIPVSPDSFVTKRHLVATRAIANYNGDQEGYQFYFIPEGTIENNIDTEKTVSFYDADLLDDASHLIDNFSEIPAGVRLTTYHGRMVLTTTYDDISLVHLSAPGEPEAFDQVDGNVIVPLDGLPITNAQEYRDVLYIYKKARTFSTVDNGDEPSTWSLIPLDQGFGASIHGIATVLDSSGVNIDYLLVGGFTGIYIFNGAYSEPDITWKISDYWVAFDRNDFSNLQIVIDTILKVIYVNRPDKQMLIGDYRMGLDPKNIRWAKWSFDIDVTSITLVEVNKLLIGSIVSDM